MEIGEYLGLYKDIDKVAYEDYTQVPTCKTTLKNKRWRREDMVHKRALEPLSKMAVAGALFDLEIGKLLIKEV